MSIYSYFFFVCNRLHFIKICLCCFVDILLYSNSLSTITTISSLIMPQFLPACLSCSSNFYLLQTSLGSDCQNIVF